MKQKKIVKIRWNKADKDRFDGFFIGDEVVGIIEFPVPEMEAPKCVVPVPPRGPNFESSGKARMEALNSDDTSKLSLFALGLKDPEFGSI